TNIHASVIRPAGFLGRLARPLMGHYIQSMCGRVIQSSKPLHYAIVDGMNVRDSRFHNYPPRWTHCFFDGCYHLIDGDVAVGLCHSLTPLFRSATAETTSLAGSAAGSGRHSKTRCPRLPLWSPASDYRNGSPSRRTGVQPPKITLRKRRKA